MRESRTEGYSRSSRVKERPRFAGAIVLCSALLLALSAACTEDNGNGNEGAATVTQAPQDQVMSSAPGNASSMQSIPDSIPELVADVSPSVVTVFAQSQNGGGEGSGVVWDGEGRIITNNHVVEGGSRYSVALASGERLDARVLATDPLTDLAVLEVDRQDLPAATFRDDLPAVGEFALAMGNPLGFESSATAGIISGLHRSIPSGGQTPALVDLLQTDAAISPGNSGGALVDGNGEVMGINVAFIPPEASAVSIGFAIPSPRVTTVVEELIQNGRATHAFLGIEPRPLTPQIASQLNLSASEGVLVFALSPGAAGEQAGLEPGDIITGFDGDDVSRIEDLYVGLRRHSPGDTVEVTVLRGDEEMTVEVTLDERPS